MKNGAYSLVRAPENYPGKRYRGLYCHEHTLVYWQTHGVIPKSNEVIHHIDGNKFNNSPNNLKLLTRHAHVLHHKNCKARYVRLKCPGCGKIFTKPRRVTYLTKNRGKVTCCSRSCIGKYTSLSHKEQENRRKHMFLGEFFE